MPLLHAFAITHLSFVHWQNLEFYQQKNSRSHHGGSWDLSGG